MYVDKKSSDEAVVFCKFWMGDEAWGGGSGEAAYQVISGLTREAYIGVPPYSL